MGNTKTTCLVLLSDSLWLEPCSTDTEEEYKATSGFWPRVRGGALRAPVFLDSLPRPTPLGKGTYVYKRQK